MIDIECPECGHPGPLHVTQDQGTEVDAWCPECWTISTLPLDTVQ